MQASVLQCAELTFENLAFPAPPACFSSDHLWIGSLCSCMSRLAQETAVSLRGEGEGGRGRGRQNWANPTLGWFKRQPNGPERKRVLFLDYWITGLSRVIEQLMRKNLCLTRAGSVQCETVSSVTPYETIQNCIASIRSSVLRADVWVNSCLKIKSSFFHPLFPLVLSLIYRRRRLTWDLAILCLVVSFGVALLCSAKGAEWLWACCVRYTDFHYLFEFLQWFIYIFNSFSHCISSKWWECVSGEFLFFFY